MESSTLVGDISQSNPFAAANRAAKLEKQRQGQEQLEKESQAKLLQEQELKARRREAARLEREARITQTVQQRQEELSILQAETEKLRRERDAAQARARQLEEQQRQMDEAQRKERAEQERLAEVQRVAREVQRVKDEAQAKRDQAQRSRREQMELAEKQAEESARMVAMSRNLQALLDDAFSLKLLSQQDYDDYHIQVWSMGTEEKDVLIGRLARQVGSYKQTQASEVAKQRQEAETRQREEEAERRASERARQVQDSMVRTQENVQSQIQTEVQRQMRLKEDEARMSAALQASFQLKDIPDGLRTPNWAAYAASLQQQLARIISAEGARRFAKMVDENAIDLDVQKTVTVLAEIVNKHPASVPAMSCLGLLAFSGSMLGYKLVKEANAIPMGIQDWTGWLLGTRMWLEYCHWVFKTKSSGTTTPFRLNAERQFDATAVSVSQVLTEQRKAAAEKKVHQLLITYGVEYGNTDSASTASAHESVIMDKFDMMNRALEANAVKFTEIKSEFDAQVSQALDTMTSDGAVLKARRQVEQSTEELTRLNDELHKAKTQEAETRHGISNSQNMIADVQMHIDAKKNRIAQLKNLLHQRK